MEYFVLILSYDKRSVETSMCKHRVAESMLWAPVRPITADVEDILTERKRSERRTAMATDARAVVVASSD